MQRKLTRKPRQPASRPSPIINFEDYTRAMTPLDRYRKHYLIFDYWNGELLDALQTRSVNPKRVKRASSESLAELRTMKTLVVESFASRVDPVIEERAKIDQQLQGSFSESQANGLWRALDAQTRRIHRELFWRDVEDQLKTVTE